jgi:hypothetical protein
MHRSIAFTLAAAALLTPAAAGATHYDIFLAGMCSQDWTGASGLTPGALTSDSPNGGSKNMGYWSGETTINASVDQAQGSLSTAANNFKNNYLEVYCKNTGDMCSIYGYSAGDLILGYALAHTSYSYNIDYVTMTAGAAGGSNLASSVLAKVAACQFAGNLTESAARGAYTHDSGYNSGTTIYRLGGNRHFLSGASCVAGTIINYLTFNFQSTCLQSHNDGAVAYHSSGAYQGSTGSDKTYFWRSTDASGTHWYSHASYWTADTTDNAADNLNHFNMKAFGACLDGGISGYSGYTPCYNWSYNQ